MLRWKAQDSSDCPPPDDAEAWREAIGNKAGRAFTVTLVDAGDGTWRVHSAVVPLQSGDSEDFSPDIVAALRAARLPVHE